MVGLSTGLNSGVRLPIILKPSFLMLVAALLLGDTMLGFVAVNHTVLRLTSYQLLYPAIYFNELSAKIQLIFELANLL